MEAPTSIVQVLDLLTAVKDEEMLANASKILRNALREDKVIPLLNPC